MIRGPCQTVLLSSSLLSHRALLYHALMDKVLHQSMGGRISLAGEKRLECSYPGRFITVLSLVPAVLFSVGVLAVAGLVIWGIVTVQTLGAAAAALAMSGWFWCIVYRRLRVMGRFIIDGGQNMLEWYRGTKKMADWPLDDVIFATAWDPFHRDFGFYYWLLARVPDGHRMRLGKGKRGEIKHVLDLLGSWGLSIEERLSPPKKRQ